MRARDEMFETLYELWLGKEYDPAVAMLTSTERGRINRAAAELRKVGATPDEVRVRWETAKRTWGPGVTLTPSAIVGNWSTLAASQTSSTDAWLKGRGHA